MKKLLTFILVLAAVLSVSGVALAEEPNGNLNIADGSILIEADGYTQGTNAKVTYTGDYVITGTATTANTITVNGGNPTITFSGLNITRNNENSSGTPVLNMNSNATIKLVGENKIDSNGTTENKNSIRHNVINIASSATLTVVDGGSGSLTIMGSPNRPVILVDGTFKMESGTVHVNAHSNTYTLYSENEGNAVLLGGSMNLNATQFSQAKTVALKTFTISGGKLDVAGREFGINVTNFIMSGGIINKITVDSGKTALSATNVSITGGNVNGYYTGAVTGRKLTKIQVNGDDYLPLANTEITVYEDGTDELKATTNGSGLIYTYLDNNTTTLKYGENTYEVTPGTDVVLGPKFSGQTFNIGAGSITAEAGTDGKTKYTQGSTVYEAAADEKVYIIGSGVTDNYLEVKSGTANVTLYNVKLDDETEGHSDDANGFIRVKGGTLNLTIEGENELKRHRGNVIFVGSVTDPTNKNAAVLNIDCAEGADCSEESCEHSLRLEVTDGGKARSAIIGGARNFDVNGNGTIEDNDNEKQVNMAGTINIKGGKVIIKGGDIGIGTPNAMAVYHYDVNITDGFVDITTRDSAEAVGIGIGRKGLEGTVMNINIIDGTVNVKNPGAAVDGNSNSPVAIGAGYDTHGKVNITIGGENSTPKVTAICDNGVAIGKGDSMNSTSGNGTTMNIDIVSGDVTATGTVGIGYTTGAIETEDGSKISISGGKVMATGTRVGIGVGISNPKLDGGIKTNDSCVLDIAISGNAEVEATGGSVAIGAEAMASGGDLEITVSDSAAVRATSDNGVAIGSTKPGNAADDYAATNSIAINNPNVTLKAAKPIAVSTKAILTPGTTYDVITDNGTQPVELPYGAIVDIDGVKANPNPNTGNTGNTGGSSYSGPSIWYIGGNTFGTSTTQMPTSVEIDYVSVPFTMEGSNIVVSCINPGARWATVKWNSTSATINFNPDANVVCAQVVIPKTGDMPIWAAIAEFLGF